MFVQFLSLWNYIKKQLINNKYMGKDKLSKENIKLFY